MHWKLLAIDVLILFLTLWVQIEKWNLIWIIRFKHRHVWPSISRILASQVKQLVFREGCKCLRSGPLSAASPMYLYMRSWLFTVEMYIYYLHVRLGKRHLHYIQPLFLCVQMSIESEMSHQRFRFLLQSGVWHLFPTLSFMCLVQHVWSLQCMTLQPCCFHNKDFFFL